MLILTETTLSSRGEDDILIHPITTGWSLPPGMIGQDITLRLGLNREIRPIVDFVVMINTTYSHTRRMPYLSDLIDPAVYHPDHVRRVKELLFGKLRLLYCSLESIPELCFYNLRVTNKPVHNEYPVIRIERHPEKDFSERLSSLEQVQ